MSKDIKFPILPPLHQIKKITTNQLNIKSNTISCFYVIDVQKFKQNLGFLTKLSIKQIMTTSNYNKEKEQRDNKQILNVFTVVLGWNQTLTKILIL